MGVAVIDYTKNYYSVEELIAPISSTQRLMRSVLLHNHTAASSNIHMFTDISTNILYLLHF